MKYKLIKEYPSSPKLNSIAIWNEDEQHFYADGYNYGLEYLEVTSYPEFWEEVKNPHYEILAFKHVNSGDLSTRRKNGLFLNDPDPNKPGEYQENHNSEIWTIYRVKRLSDGEVFTVGDETNFGKIKSINRGTHKFYVNYYGENSATNLYRSGDEHKILIVFDKPGPISFEPQYLSNVRKARKFILTTEDGVDLYAEDRVYFYTDITTNSSILDIKLWSFPPSKDFKYFSTKEAAEEYIRLNKPVFSRRQLLNFLNSHKTHEVQYGNVFIDNENK